MTTRSAITRAWYGSVSTGTTGKLEIWHADCAVFPHSYRTSLCQLCLCNATIAGALVSSQHEGNKSTEGWQVRGAYVPHRIATGFGSNCMPLSGTDLLTHLHKPANLLRLQHHFGTAFCNLSQADEGSMPLLPALVCHQLREGLSSHRHHGLASQSERYSVQTLLPKLVQLTLSL